jgi:hypothetical protein
LKKNIEGDIQFYTLQKWEGELYYGDPRKLRYDWANVNWGPDGIVNAKILLFVDITTDQFNHGFQFGQSYIESAGKYAIAYTMKRGATEKAHKISKLTLYGELMKTRKGDFEICMFLVESIVEPCIAVPYKQSENTMDAKEWIILRPRRQWYKIMVDSAKEFAQSLKKK